MDNKKKEKTVNKRKKVEFFDPGFELTAECKELIDKAKKKIAGMDKIDGGVDIMHLTEWLQTVMTALIGGINRKDFDMIAEAYIMLGQLEKQARELKAGCFQMKDPKYEQYYLVPKDLEDIADVIEKDNPQDIKILQNIIEKHRPQDLKNLCQLPTTEVEGL